jgi:hypothetical protein
MAVVGKELEHEIEQLHCFGDFHLGHCFDRSRPRITTQRTTTAAIRIAARSRQNNRLDQDGSLFFTLPTRVLTGQQRPALRRRDPDLIR